MKIAFFSNFLNHHQLPFCQEMIKILNNDFIFIATEPIPKSRLTLGYEDINNKYDFVICSYQSKKNEDYAMNLAYESDVVIIGSAPEYFIEKRLKENKLTFRYMERIFKNGYIHMFDPRVIKSIVKMHTRYRRNNLIMLCASAYAPIDISLFFAYPNKMLKWGYFPEIIEYNIKKLLENKNIEKKISIVWAGRLIKYKHPELVIEIANHLKKNNIDFKINVLGTGEMKELLIKKIAYNNLYENVFILGAMNPNEVRKYMEKANIFLFTSNYEEGWGAVLNEAMNSGCAVVASHAIGSVPFLINDGVNGYIYKNGNKKELCKLVEMLALSKELREKIGVEAYKNLYNTWNARKAADNFIKYIESVLNGEKIKIKDGPMSEADVIFQNKMYKYIKTKKS